MKIYMYTFYILEVALQSIERFSSQTDFFNLKRNTIHSFLIHITVCRGSWFVALRWNGYNIHNLFFLSRTSQHHSHLHAAHLFSALAWFHSTHTHRFVCKRAAWVEACWILHHHLLALSRRLFCSCEVTIRICIRGSSKRPTKRPKTVPTKARFRLHS